MTDRAGVARSGWGQGVAVADYDNDGFEDIYLTFFGKNVLFHNNRNGTFSDVTARAGVAAGGWSTSAAWFDYDSDRSLDLFVARYIDFSLETAPLPGAQRPGVNCLYGGFPVMCGPRGLKGMRDVLFRNNGDGTFTDVTDRAGIDASQYRGLVMSCPVTTTTMERWICDRRQRRAAEPVVSKSWRRPLRGNSVERGCGRGRGRPRARRHGR